MIESHKQKALIVHNYYQIPGGEDTVVANEKKLLEDHGHEVVLYTRNNNELKNLNIIQKLCLPFTMVFNPRTYKDIKKIIEEEKIEIVHVHNTLNLISPAVYYAAMKMKVPVIQTIHNFRFLCPGATFYRDGHICEDCVDKGLRCAVKNKCYRNSRAQTLICVINTWIHRHTGILKKINYICLTDFNKEKLIRLKHIDAKSVFVKPNFSFRLVENSEKPEKADYYLFVGRIEEIKGVRILIEAFEKMQDKKLLLAGNGPLFEELKGKATNNVQFLGQVAHDELMTIIIGAKAIILPSQVYEGFPMTIPEAFSLHTPMIVGDIGNNGKLIDDAVNGMKFKYNSVDDLIHTIDRFESTDSKALEINAYDKYQREYSADANYKKLLDIYSHIHESRI